MILILLVDGGLRIFVGFWNGFHFIWFLRLSGGGSFELIFEQVFFVLFVYDIFVLLEILFADFTNQILILLRKLLGRNFLDGLFIYKPLVWIDPEVMAFAHFVDLSLEKELIVRKNGEFLFYGFIRFFIFQDFVVFLKSKSEPSFEEDSEESTN